MLFPVVTVARRLKCDVLNNILT